MDFVCPQCPAFQCSTLDEMEIHLARDHYECYPYSCEQCEHNARKIGANKPEFCTEFGVLNHALWSHHQKFRCSVTSDLMDTRVQIRKDIAKFLKMELSTVLYACSRCATKCNNWDELEKHLVAEHFDSSAPFECEECDACFKTELAVIRHNETQHNKAVQQSAVDDPPPNKRAKWSAFSFRYRVKPQVRVDRSAIRDCMRPKLSEPVPIPSPPPNIHVEADQDENQYHISPNKWQKVLNDVKMRHVYYTLEKGTLSNGKVAFLPHNVIVLGRYALTYQHKGHSIWAKGTEVDVYAGSEQKDKVHGTPIKCKVVWVNSTSDLIIMVRADGTTFYRENCLPKLMKPVAAKAFCLIGFCPVGGFPLHGISIKDAMIERAEPNDRGWVTGTVPALKGYSGAGCWSANGTLLGMCIGRYHEQQLMCILGAKQIRTEIECYEETERGSDGIEH